MQVSVEFVRVHLVIVELYAVQQLHPDIVNEFRRKVEI